MSADDNDDTADVPRVGPTFSTLPLGPLENAVMFLREGDVGQLLRTDKDMHFSAVDSDEFWRERCCHMFGRHLHCIESLGKDAFRAFLKGQQYALDASSWGQDECFERSEQLLRGCVGASSQDNEDEAAGNTLLLSPCATMLSLVEDDLPSSGWRSQMTCGCAWADKCYWSSQPSPVPNKDEWLEYDLVDGIAVVSSFVIAPYTSFWQPDQPTYNPVEACFQLTHPDVNQGKPYYESPRFRVRASMTHQMFELPQPVLSLGGRAKVFLLGMAQRQTLGEEMGDTANHFHVCISHVALHGTRLHSCSLESCADDTRTCPRSAWLRNFMGGFEMGESAPGTVGDGTLETGASMMPEAGSMRGGHARSKLRMTVDDACLRTVGTPATRKWTI